MPEKEGLVLVRGKAVALRKRTVADIQMFLKWRRLNCQASQFDAPWEEPESDDEYAAKAVLAIEKEAAGPVNRAIIVDAEGLPIGSVNCYGDKGCQESRLVGISIYEDSRLNKGLGSEALGIWLRHLFQTRKLHRVGLVTWSFNVRMIRVAGKLGFKLEGREREVRFWDGQWLDRLHYGMLETEWRELEKKRQQDAGRSGLGG
ncbi:MAG TPA: hypothetical protein DDW31_03325 [candidate division Zixibacteria bacterium]|nr:hypothetical protein [candidate division Zixibacteria bacterium]